MAFAHCFDLDFDLLSLAIFSSVLCSILGGLRLDVTGSQENYNTILLVAICALGTYL